MILHAVRPFPVAGEGAPVEVDYRNIVTQPRVEGGFTWTLASQLGNMLREAEAEFGERDKDFTLLGVEFRDGIPQVWYPGDCKDIVIQLGLDALGNFDKACYQLSHESVHLLSPNGGGAASNLEEGLATYFAQRYMLRNFQKIMWTGLESYEVARAQVGTLLSLNPEAILQIRIQEPALSRITPQIMESVCPSVPPMLAEALCQPFVR